MKIQEIYDTVVSHLLNQKQKSISHITEQWVLRDNNGSELLLPKGKKLPGS